MCAVKNISSLSFALLLSLTACQSQLPLSTAPLRAQNATANSAPSAQYFDTALNDYRWARMEAQRWDFSARLAKVEGRYVEENGRSFEWTFYFSAIGKQKALKVSNGRKEEVSNSFFGGGIFDGSWQIDSDAALKAAKEKGLKNFPVFSMELDNFMRWEIRSADGWFQVDARTGQASLLSQTQGNQR